MFNTLKGRFAIILLVALAASWAMFRNYQERGQIVMLGLDLRGGTHMALEIDDPTGALGRTGREEAIDRALQVLRTRIDELGVAEPVVQKVGEERIVVELPGATQDDQRRAREVIQRSAFLEFKIVRELDDFVAALPRMDQAVRAAGLAEVPGEPVPARDATDLDAILQPQAAEDPAEAAAPAMPATAAAPLSSRLSPGGTGMLAVATEDVPLVQRYLALPEVQRHIPRGAELKWGFVPAEQAGQAYRVLYLLESRAMMTGEHLTDAQAQRDPQLGQPEVVFELTRRGGRDFERATGANIGNQMAILLDDRVFSAPVIQSAIRSSGRITLGGASMEEARDLALVLRAGALPAPIHIVEERSVGPSLGADSVQRGQFAGLIGISLVILVMLAYYRLAGVLAVAALSFYVIFLLGGLAGIGATLTLPGIAGIVLSIGMAVDANVLIFERIREEQDAGRSPRVAVSEGFGHALSAIVDSNITTLLTAAILFYFGTGPVRGFAVTLGIGIVASMFTAIFVTRTFFNLYVERGQPRTVSI
jgi:protein-export membrane protein SecD